MTAVDSSVAIAAVSSWHPAHDEADARCVDTMIVAHALMEAYSVLTRLPAPHRVGRREAHDVLTARFPLDRVLAAPAALQRRYLARVYAVGLSSGATYDALIALVAKEHGEHLLTLDARAARTYSAIGVAFTML